MDIDTVKIIFRHCDAIKSSIMFIVLLFLTYVCAIIFMLLPQQSKIGDTPLVRGYIMIGMLIATCIAFYIMNK
jgi:hypothetical protein